MSFDDDVVVPTRIDWRAMSRDFIMSAPHTRIANVVATFSLDNAQLDPAEIAARLPGMAVDPRKFAAGTLCIDDSAKMLVFASGRVVCAGAPSIADAHTASLDLVRLLLELGYLVRFVDFAVVNIVSYSSAGFSIDVRAVARACLADTQYDAEVFSGATFRFHDPPIVIIVFVSGSVIITSARDEREARACWAWFYVHVLERFRLDERPLTSAAYRRETLQHVDTARAIRDIARRAARSTSVAPVTDNIDALFDEVLGELESSAVESAAATHVVVDDDDAARDRLHATRNDAAACADAFARCVG